MNTFDDPWKVLGLSRDASENVLRRRYLELVKKFPPDHAPERFRAIRDAYSLASDPLMLAKRLVAPPSETPTPWSDVIAEHKKSPPRPSVDLLLSLGNRSSKVVAEPSNIRFDESHE